ncbi:MAG: hypothetical protein ACPIOQ_27940, partial [Promethearchaeia archaeon]
CVWLCECISTCVRLGATFSRGLAPCLELTMLRFPRPVTARAQPSGADNANSVRSLSVNEQCVSGGSL